MSKISFYIMFFFILFAIPASGIIEMAPRSKHSDLKTDHEGYAIIKKRLHDNPLAILTQNIKDFEAMDALNTIAEFQAALIPMRKKNPLWMIAECIETHCHLTRTPVNNPRKQFEDVISRAINKASEKRSNPVNYLAFASGYGFTDFISIINALENKVTALNFHVIELQNQSYIPIVEQFKKGHIEAFEDLPTLQELITTKIDDKELQESLNEDAIAEYLAIQKRHELYSQMMDWISIHYPQTKLRIFLYRNVAEYTKHIEKHPELIADVVGALDFGAQDKRSVHFQAQKSFDELLDFIRQQNKAATIYFDADGLQNPHQAKIVKSSRNCDSCFATVFMGALGIAVIWVSYAIATRVSA